MERTFKPMPTAEAWQVSNAPVFSMAVHRVALEQFDRAGMDRTLRAKSEQLTGYLAFIIEGGREANGTNLEVITPNDPATRLPTQHPGPRPWPRPCSCASPKRGVICRLARTQRDPHGTRADVQ
jgi:hypothetical protein